MIDKNVPPSSTFEQKSPKTDVLSTEDTETPNTAPIYGVNGTEDEITEEGTNGL